MKRLYLAASIDRTGEAIAKDISKDLGKDPRSLKTAFIYTAAEASTTPDKSWLDQDRQGLVKGGFKLFDYTITNKTPEQIDKDLDRFDVIHINGGNTFYLMWKVRESGFDKWLKKQILEKGKIFIGSSAGTQILAPNIEILKKDDTKVYEEKLKNFSGLNLIDFVIFPHWGSEKFKDVYFNQRLKISYKPENKIILLNNWQYVKVVDDMYKIIDIRD